MSSVTARPLPARPSVASPRRAARTGIQRPSLVATLVALVVAGVLLAAALTGSSTPSSAPVSSSPFGGRLAVPAAAQSPSRVAPVATPAADLGRPRPRG
jgi:hypothetical protein